MKAKERKNDLEPAKKHKSKVYARQAVAQPCASKDIVSAVCFRDTLPISFILYRSRKKFGQNLAQPPT